VSSEGKPQIAPGANRSLIASIIAFIVFLLANFASTFSEVPMMVAFLVAPSLSFIAGIIAVYYAIRSLQYIHRFKAASDGEQQNVTGKKRSITAMVIGILILVISLLAIIIFSMLAYDKRAAPNEAVGTTELRFYGDAQHREIAVQTILLPDSTLVTSGYTSSYDSPKEGGGLLLSTNLAGEEIWSKKLRGTNGRVAMLNDSTIISCRIIPYPRESTGETDTLVIHQLNFAGEVLDTLIIRLGAGASVVSVQPTVIGGVVVTGVSDRGKDDYKGRSYLFRTDGSFAKQSLRTFPKNMTGNPYALAADDKGNVLIAGFTDEVTNDSTSITENQSWALTKISSDGDLIWNKPNLTEPNIMPVDLKVTSAGKIYMLGLAKDDTDINYGLLINLDAEGEVVWSKRVSSEEAGYFWTTSMLERPGGWIVTGWISKRESFMNLDTRLTDSWMTHYISLLNTDGEIEHEFHGVRDRFEPWGIIALSDNSWLLTGMGSRGEKRDQEAERDDIGLMLYSYKP